VSKLSTEEVRSALSNSSIEFTEERRAFGNRRGVPDVVVWLSPDHDAFPDRILPVLIELEGSFSGAASDFEQFGQRYEDSDYQYYLQWPAGSENVNRFTRNTKYDIAGVPARRLGHGPKLKEREMYSIIVDWFEEFTPTFDWTVSERQYEDTIVLNWELEFRMYGHEFYTSVPYFIKVGNNLQTIIKRYISPPIVPSVVVINNEYGSNKDTISYHNTMIEFPPLRKIRFSRDSTT